MTNVITIVGNLTADPELRYTQSGLAVAGFTVAQTPRTFNKETKEWEDGTPLFMRASVWRDLAENVVGSLHKGARVIVMGKVVRRVFVDKEGAERESIELDVEEIGPSLRYAKAEVVRNQSAQNQQGRGRPAARGNDEPWGAPQGDGASYAGDTPF